METYLNNLSPYIRVANDSSISPPWKMSERVIFDYELLFVKAGQVRITIEDTTYDGRPGDVFLFKPMERHSIEIIGHEIFHQPHLHFDLYYEENSPRVKVSFKPYEAMDEAEKKVFRYDPIKKASLVMPNYIRLKNVDYFEKKLFDIIKENMTKLPFYETQMKGLFIQLWTYLVREIYWQHHPHTSSQMQVLSQVKEYITLRARSDIRLDEVASTFNMSRYHLIRLFKNAYQMTPMHFHQLMRIEKAKELLQFTDLTITDIAEQMGFTSVHSFSRAFKKMDKVAPSYYRRR